MYLSTNKQIINLIIKIKKKNTLCCVVMCNVENHLNLYLFSVNCIGIPAVNISTNGYNIYKL